MRPEDQIAYAVQDRLQQAVTVSFGEQRITLSAQPESLISFIRKILRKHYGPILVEACKEKFCHDPSADECLDCTFRREARDLGFDIKDRA